MPDTLADWLALLERRHPRKIDLGLDRVRAVLEALNLLPPPYPVLTVAGTNGKGSSVAMLSAIYASAGYLTGTYTSPHLERYNERISVDGEALDDAAIVHAFDTIERARGEVSLSYFEFATVAALLAFRRLGVQVGILEVGLGGRLDAVNAVDAEGALLTSVGLDHMEWLGADREAIGAEKAAVFRARKPAVVGEPDPPSSVLSTAAAIGADVHRVGHEFRVTAGADGWQWQGAGVCLDKLPRPAMRGEAQLRNAAGVVALVQALRERLPVPDAALRQGLAAARVAGRGQAIAGDVGWLLDVAHNAEAAGVLAEVLAEAPVGGRNLAVIGMLDGKPAEAVADALRGVIDYWYAATPDGERAIAAPDLARRLRDRGCPVAVCGDVADACERALAAAAPGDRIVVTGSFHTVGPAMTWLRERGLLSAAV